MKRRVHRARGLVVVALLALLVVTPTVDAAGRFVDDDGNVHEADIDELASLGITRGCNPPVNDRFCPDGSVTRGQMAGFLRRALDLPSSEGDPFDDDDASVFEDDIQALAQAGITRGCNPPVNDRFCPEEAVTREQMAAFLVRGFQLPAGGQDVFVDDDGSLFEGDIERLASAGVTRGCNPPDNDRYCPGDPVQRDQMASFLVRALDQTAGPPIPPPEPPGEAAFSFTVGGDIGAEEETTETLQAMAPVKGDFFLALGDMSYSDLEPESAWCDYMKGHLGADFPVQLVVGNHEDDEREDGFIGNFAACLPDRMSSVGSYATRYYFDVGDLARIIMIGAGDVVDGVEYDFEDGNQHMAWLDGAIAGARATGKQWVIVGMHRVCITAGIKGCEIGPDLMDRLIEAEVDLVLAAHDHNYQRSKQLGCATVDSYQASCVTDDGSDGVYPAGEGTVFVISGLMGGGVIYEIDEADPEYPYMAATLGDGDPQAGYGFSRVEVGEGSLEVEFVGTTTSYSDSFTIR